MFAWVSTQTNKDARDRQLQLQQEQVTWNLEHFFLTHAFDFDERFFFHIRRPALSRSPARSE